MELGRRQRIRPATRATFYDPVFRIGHNPDTPAGRYTTKPTFGDRLGGRLLEQRQPVHSGLGARLRAVLGVQARRLQHHHRRRFPRGRTGRTRRSTWRPRSVFSPSGGRCTARGRHRHLHGRHERRRSTACTGASLHPQTERGCSSTPTTNQSGLQPTTAPVDGDLEPDRVVVSSSTSTSTWSTNSGVGGRPRSRRSATSKPYGQNYVEFHLPVTARHRST
jgi:hypothetical protein